MHSKETVSILSLKYELNQIENLKIPWTYPLHPPLKICFTPYLTPLKSFNILGVKLDPVTPMGISNSVRGGSIGACALLDFEKFESTQLNF